MSEVAVFIPVYNAEPWLDEAIRSILGQTYADFELLVVDDGSTDASPEIAAAWAERDPRVRVERLPGNTGPSGVRNHGLRALDSTWIALLDHDDVMLPERLDRQLAFAQRHSYAGAIGARAEYIGEHGEPTGRFTEPIPIGTIEELHAFIDAGRVIALNHPSAMLHRERVLAIGGYRAEHDGAEDVDLWNRLVEAGYPVLQQDEVLTLYRVHGSSTMSARSKGGWEVASWTFACIHARRAGDPEPTREEYERAVHRTVLHRLNHEREILGSQAWRVAATAAVNGRRLAVLRYLAIAIAMCPVFTAGRLWRLVRREKPERRPAKTRVLMNREPQTRR